MSALPESKRERAWIFRNCSYVLRYFPSACFQFYGPQSTFSVGKAAILMSLVYAKKIFDLLPIVSVSPAAFPWGHVKIEESSQLWGNRLHGNNRTNTLHPLSSRKLIPPAQDRGRAPEQSCSHWRFWEFVWVCLDWGSLAYTRRSDSNLF